ncbi:hypothetical protein HA402_013541 [Bradysia odoriphaga]|nr:hypothetical protein HA402_013541 [Bradysia odoriphaga]
MSLSRRVAFEYSCGIVPNSSSSYIGYQIGGDRRQNRGCRIEFENGRNYVGANHGRHHGTVQRCRMHHCRRSAYMRSITCDLLLGSFRKPDPRWKDILVIVTSATIDLTQFSQLFNNAPTVQIEGRTFPVDIIYRPPADESKLHLFDLGQNLSYNYRQLSLFFVN